MTQEIQNVQNELLTKIESNQREQLITLRAIRSWVTFFGILSIFSLLYVACSALLGGY